MKKISKHKYQKKNVLKYLSDRALGPSNFEITHLSVSTEKHLPFYWQCRSLNTEKHNKIFASQWILDDTIVYGTKCNKLYCHNVENSKSYQVPLIKGIPREKQCPLTDEPSTNFGIHAIKKNLSETLLATGGENVNSIGIYKIPEFHPQFILENFHQDAIFDICWLDDSHVATCSRDSRMGIWNINPISRKFHTWYNQRSTTDVASTLSSPPISPIYTNRINTYRSHEDPCLDNSFWEDINEYYRYDSSYIGVLHQPMSKMCLATTGNRFRAMEYLSATNRLLIATMTNKLYSIDPCYLPQNVADIPTYRTVVNDMVSVRQWPQNPHAFAVGGQARFSIYDTRSPGDCINVLALNQQAGIRSLAFKDYVISYGTAEGHINFFDLRVNRHLSTLASSTASSSISSPLIYSSNSINNNNSNSQYAQLSVEGSVEQNDLGRVLAYPQTAVYTHEYDSSNMRLFAAGGPIAACISGQAACLFE